MSIQVFKKEIDLGLSRIYRIMHISDLHLSCKDELSTEKEKKEADEQATAWVKTRKDFANAFGEACEAEHNLPAEQQFLDLLEYTLNSKADALVISGDLFDMYSPANMRFIKKEFSKISIPYMWVCGNHEGDIKNYPDYTPFMHLDPSFQVIDLGEILIVGLDNSRREILQHQLERLKEIFTKGKPVLLVMHIPMLTKSNSTFLKAHCDPYFILNWDGCSETTTEFCELLKSGKTPVHAILAGHLHFENVSEFAEGKYQFVASQGLIGFINDFTLK
jgi:DNA repair exonuclease SbcCD nuclease subunit